jgi:CheY-like chemotaxis protein
MADPTQLELAVLNLAINARDAMGVGGRLVVRTANVALDQPTTPEEPPAGEYVAIGVSDTGTGMSEDVRQKVFEPFFTTKEIGKGSGLGLSQVLGFAKQSGGGVRIVSRPGAGTAVSMYLPRARAKPENEAPAAAPEAAEVAPGLQILLVDDDNAVREVTADMLRDLGYVVHEAGSGGAALDLLQRQPAIDLMLLDYAMPGMSGADLARLAHAAQPGLPLLFITGFADRGMLGDIGESQIIGKPFEQAELAHKVRAVLAEADLRKAARH